MAPRVGRVSVQSGHSCTVFRCKVKALYCCDSSRWTSPFGGSASSLPTSNFVLVGRAQETTSSMGSGQGMISSLFVAALMSSRFVRLMDF